MLNRPELFLREISLPYIDILICQYRDGNLASYLSTLLLCLNVDFDIFSKLEIRTRTKVMSQTTNFLCGFKS